MPSPLMTSPTTAIGFSLLMLAAGIGIPVMAALNATLGARLGSPTTALFILFVVGLTLSSAVMLVAGLPARESFAGIAPPYYMGAFFVVFYVLSITWAAPRIGLGNAVFLVLVGQLVSAGLIDHFGWLGAPRTPLTAIRLLGLALMAAGVFLARRTV